MFNLILLLIMGGGRFGTFRGFILCYIHGPWARGSDPKTGPIWSFSDKLFNLRKSLSLLQQYDVVEALYENREIHSSWIWIRGSGTRTGSIWPHNKMYKFIKNILRYFQYVYNVLF